MKTFKIVSICAVICILVCFIITLGIATGVKIFYSHHYAPIQTRDMGVKIIDDRKYVYILTDLDAERKTNATVLAIGTEYKVDNELNISLFCRMGLLTRKDIRFWSSPMVMIPVEYFITPVTRITTGEDNRLIATVTKKDNGELSITPTREK